MKLRWKSNHEDESQATEWRAHSYLLRLVMSPEKTPLWFLAHDPECYNWGALDKAKAYTQSLFEKEVEARTFEMYKGLVQESDLGDCGYYSAVLHDAKDAIKEYYKESVEEG